MLRKLEGCCLHRIKSGPSAAGSQQLELGRGIDMDIDSDIAIAVSIHSGGPSKRFGAPVGWR